MQQHLVQKDRSVHANPPMGTQSHGYTIYTIYKQIVNWGLQQRKIAAWQGEYGRSTELLFLLKI